MEASEVRALREELGFSQPQFALALGVELATLRAWEQGRRNATGPAHALLSIAREEPSLLERRYAKAAPIEARKRRSTRRRSLQVVVSPATPEEKLRPNDAISEAYRLSVQAHAFADKGSAES